MPNPSVNFQDDFGGNPAAPGTVNYAALVTAIQWCKDHTTDLYVPTGAYDLDITAAGGGIALPITDDLLIFGDGAATTSFTMLTDAANKSGIGFYTAIEAELEFRDLNIVGLYQPDAVAMLTQTFITFAHYGTARAGALLLTRCLLDRATHTVKSEAVTVELDHCTLHGRMGVLAAQNVDWGAVHAKDCILDLVDSQDGHYHAFYLADGCNFRAERCTWVDSDGGLAVRQGGNAGEIPSYWEVTDCDSALGIQTSDVKKSEILRTNFHGNGGLGQYAFLVLRGGGLHASRCDFDMVDGNLCMYDYSNVAGGVHVEDSHIRMTRGVAAIFHQFSDPAEWLFERTPIEIVDPDGSAVALIMPVESTSLGPGHEIPMVLGNVRFVDCPMTSENQAELIYPRGGSSLTLTRCSTKSRRGVYVQPTASLGFKVRLDKNRMECTDAGSFVGAFAINNDGVGAVSVEGGGNEFVGVKKVAVGGVGPVATGSLVPRRNDATLASAATIGFDPSSDVYLVTGVETIETLEIYGWAGSPVGALHVFHGPFTIVAQSTCALGVSGNIRPIGGARTLVPDERVTLVYDQATQLWSELDPSLLGVWSQLLTPTPPEIPV